MTWVAGADRFEHRWFVVLQHCETGRCTGRIAERRVGRFPADISPDPKGLDQAIWF